MNTSYTFDDFLSERDQLSDFENPYLKQVLRHYDRNESETFERDLAQFSEKIKNRWKPMIEKIVRIENQPKLVNFDAFNNRKDEIQRPKEMHLLEEEVFSEGMFSKNHSAFVRVAKRFLLHHNGEVGLTCPIACTDGLVALMEKFEDSLSSEPKRMLQHVREGNHGHFAIGAQYMSEIQGGSNIQANELLAVKEGDYYRLYGSKFFCSATHADYAIVTAKIENTNTISTFIVSSWKTYEKDERNHYRINRLKRKMGTTELPTAELDYDGAVAYQVGPVEKGLNLAVGIVLTRSRLDIGFASGAFMMRASREANLYANFRQVFDRKIVEFPMAYGQLQEIEEAAKRTTATAFEIYDRYLQANEKNDTGVLAKREQYIVRELILLQKVFASKEAVDVLRTSLSIFGGHGVMEEFSSLPRLFRDAIVNELWEGPRNVLLAQVFRDLEKMQSWYPINEFIADIFNGTGEKDLVDSYSVLLNELLGTPIYGEVNKSNVAHAKRWERFCGDFFYDYQKHIVDKFEDLPLLEAKILKNS